MIRLSTCIFRFLSVFSAIILTTNLATSQTVVDLNATDNTNCNGAPCDYNGPSILINELMLSPTSNDGSMWGQNATQRGEWIELYNPNICESVDISCYYLGNNANDGGTYPGGYVIPPGTVVPPAGFALIRGLNAPAVPNNRLVQNGGNVVELVVNGDGVCLGGGARLWFPNSGGWFAFYDNNGVPQDAVSWASAANSDQLPCVPTLAGCTFTGTLPHYDDFPNDRKNYILNVSAADFQGQSIRRLPDGGIWSGPAIPTMANCNGTCTNVDNFACNGTATALPISGAAPFSYLWDDPQAQTTQTASNLCAGTWCVEVTDANNATTLECITVVDAEYQTFITANICQGETYTLPDNTTTNAPGDYNFTYQTAWACDSLVTVTLNVAPEFVDTISAEICQGETYTLPDGSEANTTGTYNLAFQTAQGCDSTYTVLLNVLPPIEIPVNAAFCTGTDYTLPDGTTVNTVGIHEVLITGGTNACDTLYVVNLQNFPEFTIQTQGTADISCHGLDDGSITLNIDGSTGPYTFDWSDGQDHGTTADSLTPDTYTVQVTDANGCSADETFTITEPTPLSITATADTLICLGSFADLLAAASGGTGAFQYHWSHNASANAANTASPTAETTYTVHATDQNNCSTDTFSLLVNVVSMSDDQLTASAGGPVCAGESATVEAIYNGAHPPYTYSWNNGLPAGPGPHTTAPATITNYTVTVSDTCGNQVMATVPLTIWPLPEAALSTSTDATCFGLDNATAQITVTGGTPDFVFTWSDGQDHGANATGLTPGQYTVSITDANGCASEDITFALSEPAPLQIDASAESLICTGTDTELSAQANGGNGNYTYHWSHTTSTDPNTTVSPTSDANYAVYATDQNGCSTDTINLAVGVMSMDASLLTTSPDTELCSGESTAIEADYTGNFPPYTYTWDQNLDPTAGPHTVSPESTTTYTVMVTDTCGNSASGQITITVHPLPEVYLPDLLLSGCSPFTTALMDSINTGPGYVHQWDISNFGSLNGNPVNIELTDPGIYEVQLTVTSPEGCTTTSVNTLPIEVYPVPEADFNASSWTTDINNPEITLTNTSQGQIWSDWRIMGMSFGGQSEIAYTFPDTGRYPVQLLVENEFGCRDSITRFITINIDHDVVIPNGFTPSDNGDDPNYDPANLGNTIFYPFTDYVERFEMSIFNRWGELIFESKEIGVGWNGTYRGNPCPQDVYVYKINFVFTDGKRDTKVGDITLFR